MDLIINFLKLLIYKIKKDKIVVINEAAGLGDYLWVRNYFRIIKKYSHFPNCKIIMLSTKRWVNFAKNFDSKDVNIFISFKDPYKPTFGELILLKMFKFDVFINFRDCDYHWQDITNSISAKEIYTDNVRQGKFYEEDNKYIIEQFVKLPQNFCHTIDISYCPKINKPLGKYYILNIEGISFGMLTQEQMQAVILEMWNKFGLNVLILAGNSYKKFYKKFKSKFPKDIQKTFINGCNKFKITQLPLLVNNSKYVITVNTSILHFALQLNKKTLCFSLNNSWADYKKDIVKYLTDNNSIQNISTQQISLAIKELE